MTFVVIYMHKTNGKALVTEEGGFERATKKLLGDKIDEYIRFEHNGPVHWSYVADEYTYWMEGERFFIATPARTPTASPEACSRR